MKQISQSFEHVIFTEPFSYLSINQVKTMILFIKNEKQKEI